MSSISTPVCLFTASLQHYLRRYHGRQACPVAPSDIFPVWCARVHFARVGVAAQLKGADKGAGGAERRQRGAGARARRNGGNIQPRQGSRAGPCAVAYVGDCRRGEQPHKRRHVDLGPARVCACGASQTGDGARTRDPDKRPVGSAHRCVLGASPACAQATAPVEMRLSLPLLPSSDPFWMCLQQGVSARERGSGCSALLHHRRQHCAQGNRQRTRFWTGTRTRGWVQVIVVAARQERRCCGT